MLKRIFLGLAVVLLLAGIGTLLAQDSGAKGKEGQEQGEKNEPERQRRSFSPGQPFDDWLNELAEAHQKNDREKMGKLIEDMKQGQQMRQGRGMRGPGWGMGFRGDRPVDQESDSSAASRLPIPKTEGEKKILGVLEDLFQNQRRGMMNVPPEDGKALRLLTEAISARSVVEIGTSNGYSGLWFCLALQSVNGRLITHEIDEGRAALARKNFERAGVSQTVTLVMGDAHETVKSLKDSIDVVFIDADKEGYPDYLNKLLPLVRPGGLILAHNTRMRGGSPGIQNYIEAVTTNPHLETIFYEQGGGLGVTLKKR